MDLRILAELSGKARPVRIVDRMVIGVKRHRSEARKRKSRSLRTSADSAVRDDNVKIKLRKMAGLPADRQAEARHYRTWRVSRRRWIRTVRRRQSGSKLPHSKEAQP